MNCVNWFEALAFCIWDGGFLPSEAEYGYAEAGGSQLREYPWGATDPGVSNQYAIYDCYYPFGNTSDCTGLANIAPVGTATLGAGLYGQLDLTGNLFEWTLDSYATYVDPCTDCSYIVPSAQATPAGRGDFWQDPSSGLIASGRTLDAAPGTRIAPLGWRCARTP